MKTTRWSFLGILSLICVRFAGCCAFAAESYLLPKPTGPFAVGRTNIHLTDESRRDASGSRTDKKREFMLVVWYPAEADGSSAPAPWLPAEWVPLEAKGLLGTQLGRSLNPAARDVPAVLRSVTTHAHEKSKLAKTPQRFPLLVFGPGNYMFPNEYSSVLEEMASQGYIVVGYVPTGFVTAVSFPDGRTTSRYSRPDFSLWSGDMKYILDLTTAWNASPASLFAGRIDEGRIGMFGHSASATAIGMLAHSDKRVKAGLLLDPGLLRQQDAAALPFLLLNAENADYIRQHPDDPNVAAMIKERDMWYQASMPGIRVTLAGADHNSFTDMAVIKAFDRPGDGAAFIATTRAFVREFFGEFLLGKHSDLIRAASPRYPIATVECHGCSESSPTKR
jgi:Platelet-activating factor acetylhydrolase, isoform II